MKNSPVNDPVPTRVIATLAAVIALFAGASALHSRESLDDELAKALRRTVKCERIEIKTNTGDGKSGI